MEEESDEDDGHLPHVHYQFMVKYNIYIYTKVILMYHLKPR